MKKAILFLVVFVITFYQNIQAQDFFHQISNCITKGTAVDQAGNVYITGYFSGTLTLGTTTLESAGSDDIFVAKYDATGTPLWAKRAGGAAQDQAFGVAVSGSAVYISGIFLGTANFNTPSATGSNEITSAGDGDIFIAKYDNTGAFQWAKRAGGGIQDVAHSIAASGSSVYITGAFQSTANFNTPSATGSHEITSAGNYDIFIAKYDDAGVFQWAKRAGGTNIDFSSYGLAVSGSAVYITGSFQSTANFNTPSAAGSNEITSAGGYDIFLAKYDDTGVFQWAKRAGSKGTPAPTSPDYGFGVAVSGSAVYIAGNFKSTANFNTPSAAGSHEITSAGGEDIFLAKYDDLGNFEWAKRAGGTSNDFASAIAVSGNDVYITGNFQGTINFNTPSSATSHTLVSAGNDDVFLAKFDDTGAFVSAQRAGGTGVDQGKSLVISGSTVYVVGVSNGNTSFLASNLVCTPSVSITANPSGTITSGTSVTFTATPTNGGTPTYQWEKNNIVVGTNSATYTDNTLANNDVIKCVLTSTELCSYSVQATSTALTMSVSGVLPVELLSFSGKNTEGGNLLTWATAHEMNNKGFQVERLNIQTQTWGNLGFIAANSKAGTYQFTDNTPLSTSYYRLRQLDNDGKETLSKVISIAQKGSNKLKIYPNPVSNILTIETNETEPFQIINLLGQEILTGKATQRIDVSVLPQGNYVLKVGAEQVKFIKK